ncbi:hypothetical protein RJG79_01990 [Mycoplasmatota bacterium WC44]
MRTLIKLFIIAIIMVLVFKIAAVLLPFVIIGFGTLYLINYLEGRKNNNDEVEIVE